LLAGIIGCPNPFCDDLSHTRLPWFARGQHAAPAAGRSYARVSVGSEDSSRVGCTSVPVTIVTVGSVAMELAPALAPSVRVTRRVSFVHAPEPPPP